MPNGDNYWDKWLGGGLGGSALWTPSAWFQGTQPKPTQLTPGAISFETIVTSAVTTNENKLRLVEAYYPERMAEAVEIITSAGYDIPYKPSPTEEALDPYKVPEEAEEELVTPPFPTEPPPEGYVWRLDEYNRWVPEYVGREAVEDFGEEPEGRFYYDDAGNLHQVSYALTSRGWDQQDKVVQFAQREPLPTKEAEWEKEQRLWQQQQTQQQYGLQQQELEQQAQYYAWQQAEAQRQYGAQLAAQPQSWLEYAAYTGEQPAIQPWMLPLMPQEYQQLGAGQAIPGWQAPQAGQMDGVQGMAGLPGLTRPSRQYQARMGPTAKQQYYGYQQARTGVRPEEEQWRLWSGAPPGGRYQGLGYTR